MRDAFMVRKQQLLWVIETLDEKSGRWWATGTDRRDIQIRLGCAFFTKAEALRNLRTQGDHLSKWKYRVVRYAPEARHES